MSDSEIVLEPDVLMQQASRRADGLTDLGEGQFMEPLTILTDSLASEANLNDIGKLIAQERILGHAVNRLNYVNDRKKYPEIAQQVIRSPVFIVGLPRTGSTILHDIMAQDPASRAPLTWEVDNPSPPPQTATYETDPRIAIARAKYPEPDPDNPGFAAIHPTGAQLAQECLVMMGEVMCTPLFHNQFRVPTYEDWVDFEADFSKVYDFHYQQLQHLQSHHMRERWVLKSGVHMWGLEHLLAKYPDARIVFTHRDPVDSVTSFASLTTAVRGIGSDTIDQKEIAEDWTARLVRAVAHAHQVRDGGSFPEARFYDMRFSDFVTDQLGVVEQIYDALGLPMTPEAATAMKAFIDDNPKGKHGAHEYTHEDYGVIPSVVHHDFRDYIDRFDLLSK